MAGDGGGFYVGGNVGQIGNNFSTTYFDQNTSGRHGGGFHAGNLGLILNSNLSHNKAGVGGSNTTHYSGGGGYVGSHLYGAGIQQSKFHENQAHWHGGGLYVLGDLSFINGKVWENEFISNKALNGAVIDFIQKSKN